MFYDDHESDSVSDICERGKKIVSRIINRFFSALILKYQSYCNCVNVLQV